MPLTAQKQFDFMNYYSGCICYHFVSSFPPDDLLDVPEEGAQLRVLAVEPAPLPLRAALAAQLLQEEAEVRLLREGVPVPQLGYRHRHAVRLEII